MSGACLLLSSSSLVGRKVVEVSPARRLMVPIPDFRCCVVQELEEGEIVEETVWPYLPPPPPADPRGRRFIFLALAIFCCLITCQTFCCLDSSVHSSCQRSVSLRPLF